MSETVQPTASTSMVQLGQIIAALGGELVGPAELEISRIAPIEQAQADAITFLANPKYRSQLATTAAGCVVVSPLVRDEAVARGAVIVAADPYLYFAHLTQWWARRVRPLQPAAIHPSAVVDPSATLGEGVTIGPLAVVEADVVLGAGVVIGPHSVIGRSTRLGAGTRLAAQVTIGYGCQVGERCIFHSGVVIGADGFGFAPTPDRRWEKIEQLGAVRIGNDVEIGANSCVDRGALDDTVIEDGVKIDNLVQVGHNVRIGAHAAMAGCVGIAGSSVISAHCTIGGAAMISGHLTLGEGVHVSAGTLVSRSIKKPGLYSGVFPFDDHASWEKNAATLRSLHALRDRVRALEK